jgi:hypothetical protein
MFINSFQDLRELLINLPDLLSEFTLFRAAGKKQDTEKYRVLSAGPKGGRGLPTSPFPSAGGLPFP